MIVVLSNSLDVTADYVCSRLEQGQFDYVRLDTDYLTGKTELLYKFDNLSLVVDHRTLVPENINSIWYRRPQPLKPPVEKTFEKGEQSHALSEWSAAIEGFLAHIPTKLWINHPRNNASAASKLEQLSRAKRLGLTIPKTLVTQSFEETIEFWKECKESLVVKPISHGYIERENSQEDTLIFTNEVTLDQLNNNRELLSLSPTTDYSYIFSNSEVAKKMLCNDLLISQDYNERVTNFMLDLYRAALRYFSVSMLCIMVLGIWNIVYTNSNWIVNKDKIQSFIKQEILDSEKPLGEETTVDVASPNESSIPSTDVSPDIPKIFPSSVPQVQPNH